MREIPVGNISRPLPASGTRALLARAGGLLGLSVWLLSTACASRNRSEVPDRVSAREAHERMMSGQVLIVCAYDQKDCLGTHLEGSITLEELSSRLSTLPKDQPIIFVCG